MPKGSVREPGAMIEVGHGLLRWELETVKPSERALWRSESQEDEPRILSEYNRAMEAMSVLWWKAQSVDQRPSTYTEVKLPEPIVDDPGAMRLTIGALESGGFYAADDFTDQFGEGETPEEAYAALCQVLRDYLVSLNRLSGLLPHQARHRRYIKELSTI